MGRDPFQEPRILVVDDDPEVGAVLGDYLTDEGYVVEAVETGEDALALVRRQPPDVVLLDVRLPGMSGLEVLRHLRCDYPAVAVLMVTAVDDESVARMAMEFGAIAYISKPFALTHIHEAVRTAIDAVRNIQM